jgi:hypothetical protein
MYVIDQPQALTCLSAAVDANEYPTLSGLNAVLTSAAYFFSPFRRCVFGFVASGNMRWSSMSTIETMVLHHILLCLSTEWSHHWIILFLRYLPLDPPLLLHRCLLPPPLNPSFLHQQSARALRAIMRRH